MSTFIKDYITEKTNPKYTDILIRLNDSLYKIEYPLIRKYTPENDMKNLRKALRMFDYVIDSFLKEFDDNNTDQIYRFVKGALTLEQTTGEEFVKLLTTSDKTLLKQCKKDWESLRKKKSWEKPIVKKLKEKINFDDSVIEK